MVPALRFIAAGTSAAARFLLSVRHSMRRATPWGAYPSYMIVVESMDSPVSPAPRLIARSMLSLGTEVFLAFCTASTSVGLPERSAPPSFAATSMFLMSFANDLARRESMIAFLCLVVAHLECPDINLLRPVCAHAD